jgi:hypothetical protein
MDQKTLKNLLLYNEDTGEFKWKKNHGRVKKNSPAGGVNSNGYILIMMYGKNYRAHRLAWLFVNGQLPEDQIDHINGEPTDNRISNLRAVSNIENCKNQKKPKNNTSGVVGVSWHKIDKKWMAHIAVKCKKITLKRSEDKFEAICARKSAEIKYGYHPNHGR